MTRIEIHHRSEIDGYICPEDGKFVMSGHFLNRGFCNTAREDHLVALQVITIYVGKK